MTVDSKLASFQQALLEKQTTWEKAQDNKLQALQTAQQELKESTQMEFASVHETAANRHRDLMSQMTSMMAVLQAHGPGGEKRPGEFPEHAVAKARTDANAPGPTA